MPACQRLLECVDSLHQPDCVEQVARGCVRVMDAPHLTPGAIHRSLDIANTLAELEMDAPTITAGLILSTYTPDIEQREILREQFGTPVLDLVEGVARLKHLEETELQRQQDSAATRRVRRSVTDMAANLRKIFLAMGRDLRVVVIKTVERLHAMESPEGDDPEALRRIAEESLNIYSPLMHRLGVWQLKWRLEDTAFKIIMPEEYHRLSERVSLTRREREEMIERSINMLRERLAAEGISGQVFGRPKHLWSVYNKMIKEQIDLDQVFDLLALRVITDTVSECYQVLGIVHDLWMPIPGRFDDFIATPKSNGYQSIHTKVYGPSGRPLEVQIRTWEQHRKADFGVAAHWLYKEGSAGDDPFEQRLTVLRQQLFDWQVDGRDTAPDFLKEVVERLFKDQVYVFTPQGQVIEMASGSTPVDVAFRIHTDLGHTCAGAKVNGRIVPLNTELKNGDVVEIIARSNAKPSRDWLNFVQTAHARSKIKAWFRKQEFAENVIRGRDLLEKELERLGHDPHQMLRGDALANVGRRLGFSTIEEVLAAVADGRSSAVSVAGRLVREQPTAPAPFEGSGRISEKETRLQVGGIDNVVTRRARCCNPVPGDDVVGYTSRGRGMMLHHADCPNARHHMETEPDRVARIDWSEQPGAWYAIKLSVMAAERNGLLNEVSAIFSDTHINVSAVNARSRGDHTAQLELTVEVSGKAQIDHLLDRIRSIPSVYSVQRQGVNNVAERRIR